MNIQAQCCGIAILILFVSEGVETKEQMEKISSLGIDYIQGCFFPKPLPGDEFLQYIRKENGC